MRILKKFKIGYWNVGIIEQSIDAVMSDKPYEIRWMRHRYKDRFFADPFLHHQDDENYYILAEELIFVKDKGTIVLLQVNKKTMKLVKRTELIEDEYHLSYPNPDGSSIVAENYKSGGLNQFILTDSKVTKERILDTALIDPTFLEYEGNRWLFGTTKEQVDDANRKLSIFIKQGNQYIPHKKNPVKIDVHSSRPGGKFFWYKGELYRPAQNCEHLYGEDIHIMKVKHLDEETYEEEYVRTVSSHGSSRYNLGLHTFNVYKGL